METSVLNRLDKTAAAFPDKVMFRDETAEITFGEFDRLTKAVGTYLAQRVPAGSPVAALLLFGRCPRRLLLCADGRRYAADKTEPDHRRYPRRLYAR